MKDRVALSLALLFALAPGCTLIGDFGSFGPEDAGGRSDAGVDAATDAGSVVDAGPIVCAPACAADQDCVEGSCVVRSCVPACGTGETCFGQACLCGGGPACGLGETCVSGACQCTIGDGTEVDVLFMVDNSNSMSEEQAALAAQIPTFVRVLGTGDLNLDGSPEFPAVRDLHLAVVTSDMGTNGFVVPTCPEPMFGDDGLLRTLGRTDIAGCMASYPPFLAYDPSQNAGAVATQFACVATAGTGGCGFEQQLEAVLKAVTPTGSPIRFFNDTLGHGDNENAGFLRRDSVFAAVLLTDENDCSASIPELFNPASTIYPEDLNLRCFYHPEAQHPIERYVDGVLALRRDPRDVIFAAIAGVPVGSVGAGYPPAYDTILARADMQEVIDPTEATRLTPSCNTTRGLAFPPRRIVEVARDIHGAGGSGVIGSICQDDYTGPVNEILRRLLRRLDEACTP